MAEPIPYEDILDEDLRTQLQNLNLTIPHPQSILDPRINSYDVNFYQKLCAMEAYTYEKSEQPKELNMGSPSSEKAGVEEYGPYWQTFNDALVAYVTHAPMSSQKIKDVIAGLFGFLMMHYGHGAGSAETIPNSNAKVIFVLNGFIETTLNRPIEYYDDLVPDDPMAMPEPITGSAERLEADPLIIDAAWDADVAKVDVLLGKYSNAISDVAVNAMFGNTDPDAQGPSQAEAWDIIFIDLNWQWYIDHFQSSVKIPPRPPEPDDQ